MKVSLVIPMYNERESLPETLASVTAYMRKQFGDGAFEILFSDDGSRDGSPEIVEKFADEATRMSRNGENGAADGLSEGLPPAGETLETAGAELQHADAVGTAGPAIRVLRGPENRGKGYAVRRGMLAARGDILIFTDCDLAYGTAAIGEIYDALVSDSAHDAVIASRALHPAGYEGYSFFRRFLSRSYRAILRLFFGLRLSDSQSGLKAFRREAARAIFSRAEVDRYAFDFELILIGERLGVRFGEMPARVILNNKGKIRLFRDSLRMLCDLVRIRRRVRKLPRGEEDTV